MNSWSPAHTAEIRPSLGQKFQASLAQHIGFNGSDYDVQRLLGGRSPSSKELVLYLPSSSSKDKGANRKQAGVLQGEAEGEKP